MFSFRYTSCVCKT